MQNVRYNISPCSPQEAEAFIAKVDKTVYIQRATVKADDRSHYDRYAFVRDDNKVAVVYDTSASVISITAPERFADDLLNLFGAGDRTVKKSTVPAQNNVRREPPQKPRDVSIGVDGSTPDTRARLFVSPESIRYRPAVKSSTVIATAKGLEISTDEIFPPQRAKPRTMEQDIIYQPHRMLFSGYGRDGQHVNASAPEPQKSASVDEYFAKNRGRVSMMSGGNGRVEATQSFVTKKAPRNTKISFGDDDEENGKTLPERPRAGTGVYSDIAVGVRQESVPQTDEPQKKKRGRPRKETATADIVMPPELREIQAQPVPEYKNGYSVKNFPEEKLTAMLKRLKSDGYAVKNEGMEFGGTSQEVKMYAVSDASGAKVYLRYATKKMTVQLQGKRSELFGEIQSQVSRDSDYSSALENYIEESTGGTGGSKVSDMENKLKKRLPTAYGFLSEQSRIDFSYGLHDFSQNRLLLSDYSVLLVPPYRGLERFVFDLQRSEGIKVKMIGQAYDKDDSGNYVLKNGYSQRIGSVVYDEVMVALYTEYFSRRNFFAHSDNSDDSRSRAIIDRNVAKGIFEHLLDVVEYNAKKLKEIGFTIKSDEK